jgi:uncharacterized protein (DUF362 family)
MHLDRRKFLKLVGQFGGAIFSSTFLSGCLPKAFESGGTIVAPQVSSTYPSTNTPIPPETPTSISTTESSVSATATASGDQKMAQVAFVKTNDRADGVRRALDLLEINPVSGKNLFLKPNFNSADPTPGSTHNDVLRELILHLQDLGAEKITVGDRSGMGNTETVMRQKDIFRMAEELGFETIVFDDLQADDWELFPAQDSHWERGFTFARPVLEADGIIQTCCLKTHRFGGHFTLSLKNSVGLVAKYVPGDGYNYMSELHGSPHQRGMIAEINTAYAPDFIVMDGVEAFVNAGPDQGKLVDAQVMLAGTDRVALDAVGVALLRYYGTTFEVSKGRIFDQEQIARAVELGLGVGSPLEIELITGDPESQVYADQINDVLQQG